MRTACLVIELLFLTSAVFAQQPHPKPEIVTKSGKVVWLSAAIKSLGIPPDPDPIARQAVLVEKDGTITPILSDESSRAFYLDERMRDRKVELTARRFTGLPYLQVVAFKVEENGELRVPEYYCEICAISVRYPQTCPCCQGPMEFRMKP